MFLHCLKQYNNILLKKTLNKLCLTIFYLYILYLNSTYCCTVHEQFKSGAVTVLELDPLYVMVT